MNPQFICSYQGEGDYQWKGRRYRVRWACDDWRPGIWNYTPEEFAAQRIALVGCILGPDVDQFPPEELAAHFPGYVRARFDTTTWTAEYATGHAPDTVRRHGETFAKVWQDEMRAMGIE